MEYLLFHDTEWIGTNRRCPRDGRRIYREVRKKTGIPTNHFCCERMGCTWPDYPEKELAGLDRKRFCLNRKGLDERKMEKIQKT